MPTVLLIGTLDTKGAEYAYVRELIKARGHDVLVMDIGVLGHDQPADITAAEVARSGGSTLASLRDRRDRGAAIDVMLAGARTLARELFSNRRFDGVLGLGGGGGTAMITAAMRELPVGVPKIMVSTLASGDVAPYVGVSDIVMMPSVTDMAGLNRLSRVILDNAASAITAMANRPAVEAESRPALGLTMFGVTTACVTNVVAGLKDRYDCMVFHATGTGGRSMEKLADSGMLEGVIDVTTTEVCDLLFGGVLFLGERYAALTWIGGAIIAAGVVMTTRAQR